MRAVLALGYAGWSPGQLETEIQSNGWLHCPADPDLIFDEDLKANIRARSEKWALICRISSAMPATPNDVVPRQPSPIN